MRLIIAFYIVVFFIPFVTYSQPKIDSLFTNLRKAKSAKDSLVIYAKICKEATNNASSKDGLKYTSTFLKLAQKENDLESQSMAYRYFSEIYMSLIDFDKAVSNAQKGIAIISKNKNLDAQLLSYNQLGRVYQHFGKSKLAISIYEKGISLYDGSKVPNIHTLYTNLGKSYWDINERDKAYDSYKKAMNYSEKFGKPEQLSHDKYIMGYNLMDNFQFKEAETYFIDAIKDSLRFENKDVLVNIHHALGINYSRWGKYQPALKHDLIALQHWKNVENRMLELDALNNISTLYYRWEKFTQAEKYAIEAFNLSKKLNNGRFIAALAQNLLQVQIKNKFRDLNALENTLVHIEKYSNFLDHRDYEVQMNYWEAKSYIQEKKGLLKESLKSYKMVKVYSDSLLQQKQKDKIEEFSKKYETEKKNEEIKQLNLEKDKQQRNLIISICGVVILALFVFGMYFLFRKTTKQRDLILELQKELHHTLKNNLGFVDTFIEVAKSKITDLEVTQVLEDLKNRIFTLFSIHQTIYKQNNLSGKAEIKGYINILMNKIEYSFSDSKLTFENKVSENLEIEYKNTFYIGLIINEFVTNSFKYGNKNPIIEIMVEKVGDNINFKIWDKNTIAPVEFNPLDNKGFGVSMINLMAVQLGGKGEWDKNNGLAFSVKNFS